MMDVTPAAIAANQRPCKKCGCPIALIPGENGRHIPLDLRSPVFRIVTDMMGEATAQRDTGAFVTHFCTCPEADAFSSKRKAR